MRALILCLLLAGCATPHKVEHRVVAGVVVVAHIDTFDAPDGCGRSHRHGCHQQINGVHHVWYSEVSPPFVLHHEIKGHARGMQHGEYSLHGPFGKDWCATVTVGNEHYPLGALICNDGRNEWIVEGETT